MRHLTQNKFNGVLSLHKLWLENKPEGVKADLSNCNLQGANLQGANLQYANLQGANLQYANLRGADLQGANLHSSNLQGANLHSSNLRGADLQGANLTDTILQNKIILSFQYNKHTISYLSDGIIQIGCEKHSINVWLENFEKIGKNNNYTDKEIAMYGKMIKGIAKMQKDMESL